MVVATDVRPGHAGALLAAFQSAKGTGVTDFTAATALRLWTPQATVGAEKNFAQPVWMDTDSAGGSGATWPMKDRPAGVINVHATADALEALLTCHYGTFAGGTFTYATQVTDTRYLTLGWVEDRYDGTSSTDRFVRTVDTWVHRLEIIARPFGGPVLLRAHYAARSSTNQLLNAGGITLPAVPMAPTDIAVASPINVTLTRDPAGTPVVLRFRDLRLTLEKPLGYEWDTGALSYDVFQRGKLHATLEFTGDWCSETWAIRDRSASDASDRYQLAISFGSTTFTANLYNVKMTTNQQGHDGFQYVPFAASGEARTDGSNFVSLTLA